MKIAVIIGSIREGRVSDRLAKWVVAEASKHAEVELIDLNDYPMPFFDEAGSPRFIKDRQPDPAVKKWLDKIDPFDGYVLVTPEYNRSTSGVLKNAIDFIDFQFDRKPVALVAHGSSGGAQAVSHLRGIIPGVNSITVPQAVYFVQRVGESIDENGELNAELKANPYGPQTALAAQMASLVWYAEALSVARANN